MSNFKKILIVIVNIAILLNMIFAEVIYTSYYPQLSWYENSGTQFLAIVLIVAPIFVFTGFARLVIAKGNIITHIEKNMSWIGFGIFLLPIILDTSLNDIFIMAGVISGIIVIFVQVYIIASCIKFFSK